MTRPCIFALGLGLGALVSPVAQVLAAKYADRHWLDVQAKEFPA